ICNNFEELGQSPKFAIKYLDDGDLVTLHEDIELVDVLEDAKERRVKAKFIVEITQVQQTTLSINPAVGSQHVKQQGSSSTISKVDGPTNSPPPTPPPPPYYAGGEATSVSPLAVSDALKTQQNVTAVPVLEDEVPSELHDMSNFDIMLSYQWNSQELVVKIKEEMVKRGLRVWMDVHKMTGNIYQKMAEGVLKSTVFVPCLTNAYEKSANCKSELCYARDMKKTIVPNHLETGPFKSWAGLITAGLIYVDLSTLDPNNEKEWNMRMETLHLEVRNRIQELGLGTDPSHPPPAASMSDAKLDSNRLHEWLRPVDFSQDMKDYENMYVPETREWLLRDVEKWLATKATSSNSSKVLWLNGVAGVGKSMMAWLIGSSLSRKHADTVKVCRFFCRHNDDEKNDVGRLINTIAYDLAQWRPEVRDHLLEIYKGDMKSDSRLMDKSIRTRFKELILDPLSKVPSSPDASNTQQQKDVVIILDAIDECGRPGTRNRAQLLSILSTDYIHLPPFVKLIITSRPEEDIWESLHNQGLDLQTLEPSHANNLKDLETYASHRLQHHFTSPQALGQCVSRLSGQANGLFIWMRLACDAIDGREPETDEEALSVASDIQVGMDFIYRRVLAQATSDAYGTVEGGISGVVEDFQLVMAAVCTLKEPLTQPALAAFLGLSESRLAGLVLRFRSIFSIERTGVINVMHKSVVDFLTNPERCEDTRFVVDTYEASRLITRRCMEWVECGLHENMCGLEPGLLHSEITDFTTIVNERIPLHIQYSCKYWMEHFLDAVENGSGVRAASEMMDLVDDICSKRLLNWVEAMSLLGRLDAAWVHAQKMSEFFYNLSDASTTSSSSASASASSKPPLDHGNLFSDLARLVRFYYFPIAQSALQVYITALPLLPQIHD
ncbi:hypothetical protein HK102_007532, partial [Quaeritorhiza haematococci]